MVVSAATSIAGCYQSSNHQDGEVTSDAASQTNIRGKKNDGGQGVNRSDEHSLEENDYWPIMPCIYEFYVMEKEYPFDESVYEPLQALQGILTYEVSFIQGVDHAVFEGPDFFHASDRTRAEFVLETDSTETMQMYHTSGFLAGGMLRIWKGENEKIIAELDIFGSGVPLVRRYSGYLTVLDCGPPVM